MVIQADELPKENNIEQWELEMLVFSDWKNHHTKKSSDFNSIIEELKMVVEKNPDRPRLRIILGRFYGYKAGVMVREAREKGVKPGEKIDDPDYMDSIVAKEKNYKKALALDEGSLSFDEYEIINYPTIDSDTKVEVSRRQLKLFDEGVWPPKDIETDHPEVLANYDYTLYERIVTAYIDENRFDEALAVVKNEMAERFPDKQQEIKEGIVNIEKRKSQYLQRGGQKASEETETLEKEVEPSEEKSQEQLQNSSANKHAVPDSVEKKETKIDREIFYIFIGIIVMFVLGGVILLKKRKAA